MALGELENTIGYTFKSKDLLKEALTHRSYLNEHPEWKLPHNERLEFLGDAVLELVASEYLFREFPDFEEGKMTVVRAALVQHNMLVKAAKSIDLEASIFMSKGERSDSAKAKRVIIANAFEALIGAIYLDGGFEPAEEFVRRFMLTHTEEVLRTESYRDAKSELQELAQERLKVTPTYQLLEAKGPAHDRTFKAAVYFDGDQVSEGSGRSKQAAEVQAAERALEALDT